MADKKTDPLDTARADVPVQLTRGLSATPQTASHPAVAKHGLDTLFHRTDLHLRMR
jgi:hypothetical protein